MGETIVVGMAEIVCARLGAIVLVAPGVSSGICICAFDARSSVAGMAHVILPESHDEQEAAGKFASSAVPCLLQRMIDLGADRSCIRTAVAGAARISALRGKGPRLEIGRRNEVAVQAELGRQHIAAFACDLGGSAGRTIRLSGDGRVRIDTVGQLERELANLAQFSTTTFDVA